MFDLSNENKNRNPMRPEKIILFRTKKKYPSQTTLQCVKVRVIPVKRVLRKTSRILFLVGGAMVQTVFSFKFNV